MRDLLHALYRVVAQSIVKLHDLTGMLFGEDSGISWALAIVLLTIIVRALMYPLFVKQIKTQRAMQTLQPKIKELQKKHKGDKESLNKELMQLYKEHNANPLAGCLPMLLQMPIFIALYQVLHQLTPKVENGRYFFPGDEFGVDVATIESLERAKIFGAPIGAGFQSKSGLLEFLNANPGPVKLVAVVLIIAMAGTTFLTSKQMMGRNAATDSSQATQQKVLLYVMPLFLGIFGFQVAIGVLLYWTTTNVFSMVQQTFVMSRLGPVGATPPPKRKTDAVPAGPAAAKRKPAAPKQDAVPAAAAADAGTPARPAAAAARRPNNRNTKRGKGQRRGKRR